MTAEIAVNQVRFEYPGAAGHATPAETFSLRIDGLRIGPAERVACIGPSGCGKTTLIHLIAGILTPASGTVTVGDQVISALSDRQRRDLRITRIGLVFQRFELIPYLSALDNILLPCHVNASLQLTPDARRRAAELAESLAITPLLRRRPDRLSQGERQRVAIARALIAEPRVLLCDEPTGNLDPKNGRATLDLLLREAERLRATVLVVTHDHAILDRFGRVIDLADVATLEATATGERP